MKNILAACIKVLFVLLSKNLIDAQEWNYGDGGKVKWQFNCDFPGYDIGSKVTPGENCGQLCITDTHGCSHFSYFKGICYLKRAPHDIQRQPKTDCLCGFLSATTSGPILDKRSWDYQILHKTIFAEARGEPELGQRAVAWVIKNRADKNRSYWGGNTLAGVCLQPFQFECWNPDRRHLIDEGIRNEPAAFSRIDTWLPSVYLSRDPTGGAEYYNNPDKEGFPPWTNNVIRLIKIGHHQFYKDK